MQINNAQSYKLKGDRFFIVRFVFHMITAVSIQKTHYQLQLDVIKSESLVLTLSDSGFELAEFSKSPYVISQIASWKFESAIKNDTELATVLIQFATEYHLTSRPFSSVAVNWIGSHFTLLPSSFFEAEKVSELLEFNIGKNQDERIFTNDVGEIKLVYSIPSEVKNALDKLFPSHQLKHIGYSTIKLFFNHFQLKNSDLFLNVHNGQTEIIIKKDKQPLMYNVYSTLNDEDILYYLLFSIEQFNLNTISMKLSIAANIPTSASLFTAIKKYIRNTEFAVSDKLIIRKEELEKLPHHYYFNTLNRILCE